MTSAERVAIIERAQASASALVPFVTSSLSIYWLPVSLARGIPAGCFWLGEAPAWRLVPFVYAHLHRAVEKRLHRTPAEIEIGAGAGPDPATVRQLTAALDRVHEVLVSIYPPADVHPWSPNMPPLPKPPTLPAIEHAWRRDEVQAPAPAEIEPIKERARAKKTYKTGPDVGSLW